MADIERVKTGIFEMLQRCSWDDIDKERHRFQPVLNDAFKLLKEQPKWIPINERKPNSCGVYIVARWFIDGCRRKILTDACYFDGSNTWHDDTRVNHSRPYLTDKIVAWMPLPNPLKDGEQE